MKLLHKLAHLLHLNGGFSEVWWQDGKLMAGFICATCGEVAHIHEVPRHISHPEEFRTNAQEGE